MHEVLTDERYGGQGLSQTGYARVFETIGAIDATLVWHGGPRERLEVDARVRGLAFADATGLRLHELPASPDRLLDALQARSRAQRVKQAIAAAKQKAEV